MHTKFNIIGIFTLVFAMFIWASSFIALKSAIGDIGPFSVIFLRMLIASACFLYFIKSFLKYTFTKEDLKYILLLALFEPCLYFIFEAKALQNTTASQAGMITSMMPLITAMGAGFFLKEFISKQLIFGSSIAVIGAVWLSLEATTTASAPNPFLGNSLEFCAMICGAGYTIVARYLTEKFSALFITALQSFIGAIFFFPFFIYEYNTLEMVFSTEAMLWIAYLGVVVTLGGYGLYNYSLTKIEASQASVFINLIPVFTLVFAVIILKERLTFVELLASAIILTGVAISQIRYKKKK